MADLTGTKQVVAVTPTDASIADFHNDGTRMQDFQAFMEGDQNAQGGQHDMNARGMTTDLGHFQQPQDFTGTLIPEQPVYVPNGREVASPPPPQEEQEWRVRYGRSENEKGEYRRLLEESLAREARLAQQFIQQAPPVNPPNYPNFQDNGYANQYTQYSQVPPQVTHSQPPSLPTRFVQKPDGEMVYAEDLEATIQSRIAPAFTAAYEDFQRTRNELNQMRQALAERDRAALGITPQLEAQALVEKPWIRNLRANPDPTAYNSALADYKSVLEARQAVARPMPTPQPPQALTPGTSAAAARRITYVEPASTGGGFEPHNQPSDFQREMSEAMSEGHVAKRAGKMREVFAKYGVYQANDWRDPSVSTGPSR